MKSDISRFMNKENGSCLLEWFQKVAEGGKITKEALNDWVVRVALIGLLPFHLISFTVSFLSVFCLIYLHDQISSLNPIQLV